MEHTQAQPQQAQRPPMNVELPDIKEYGAAKDGVKQSTDRRLFIQLQAFTNCGDARKLIDPLKKSGLECVLYLDLNDTRGVAVAFATENPEDFTGKIRDFLNSKPFSQLTPKPEFTMIGRSYSVGHEQDLEDWLLKKPRRNLFNPKLEWAVWYPLRRKGEFEALSKDEQRPILMEHAKLGMGYGQAELAHDIRLACHGLDKNDNEFVLGIVAYELAPISKLVQDMRRTQQTSQYIASMGPFFVGKVYYRSR